MIDKKIFISYSWSTPAHEQWVLELAQRLVNDGIDVILDKWNLKPGHDKYAFMEQMVHATDIDKVLVILDKKYAEKANDRNGGVGNETAIISPKVYESTVQEKFIPIVAQLDENGKAILPTYLSGKIYIDLSSTENFEHEYEKLLRNIYERPLQAKPKLGTPPRYLFEDTPVNYKTTILVRAFDTQIERNPDRINVLARDFFDEFRNNLKNFKIESSANTYLEFGEQLYNVLVQMTPLRDDYILFIDKLLKGGYNFDTDILIGFFEDLTSFLMPDEGVHQWRSTDFENFKFIIGELFIYTVAIGLKRENYKFLEDILHTKYFLKNGSGRDIEPESYGSLYFYIDSLDQYYMKLNGGQRYLSCQADLIIKRIPEGFKKNDFIDGDLLCFYIAQLNKTHWFPRTYIYKSEYSNSFSFFNRLVSKKHFEKVKGVLGVDGVEELKEKINMLDNDRDNNRGYSNSHSRIRSISSYIKPEQIGSTR